MGNAMTKHSTSVDTSYSARVFLLIIEFISNLPRDMKPKLTREERNYLVYGDNVTNEVRRDRIQVTRHVSYPIFHINSIFYNIVHWIEKTEECFEKQLENLTKERTLSAIARRSNERLV
ncbi:hypothetical protein V1477_021178 [Vespula maculifrons]|uniref:Uncharacterized protein n=1 Tax=Vespula maculifrons TaxID=7453 RepID=A0ABD2AGY3_VESMC